MKVKIKYFASMREKCGKSDEVLDTNSINPRELFDEITNKYSLNININTLKVAINESYESFETKLQEMDVIAFIPPVAGG